MKPFKYLMIGITYNLKGSIYKALPQRKIEWLKFDLFINFFENSF
jgi:hypothetical protein